MLHKFLGVMRGKTKKNEESRIKQIPNNKNKYLKVEIGILQ